MHPFSLASEYVNHPSAPSTMPVMSLRPCSTCGCHPGIEGYLRQGDDAFQRWLVENEIQKVSLKEVGMEGERYILGEIVAAFESAQSINATQNKASGSDLFLFILNSPSVERVARGVCDLGLGWSVS
jgi:hypothetical protein